MVVYICERCLCAFNRKSNYDRHINIKLQCKIIEQKGGDDELYIIVTEMQKEMNKLKEDAKEMKKTIDSQKKIINTNNNYKKCNVTNNNVNIVAFGKEDLDFITDDVYKKILNKGYGAHCAFAEHVHFNKNQPNNQNVFLSNIKDTKYITVNDGEKWIKRH